MKIIKSQDKEWLEREGGYSKKILLDEKDLSRPGSLIQYIRIKPGETAKSHYHKKQTEIFYFLNENGHWIIDGKKMSFKTGDILVVEPPEKHIIVNDTNEDYIYLAIKFDYDPKDSYY